MKSEIDPKRLLKVLVICLALLGTAVLAMSGQALHMGAAVAGYLRAELDLLAGKRVLHLSAFTPWNAPRQLAATISGLGLPTEEMYYSCLSSTPCGSYHRTYDAEVRKEINRKFGYDVIAEVSDRRRTAISIVIHHK